MSVRADELDGELMRARVLRAYAAGKSSAAVAGMFGLPVARVAKCLREAGVMRPPTKPVADIPDSPRAVAANPFDPGALAPSPRAGDGSASDPEPGRRCPLPPLAPLSKSPRSVARLQSYAARDAYTRGKATSPTRPLSECDSQWNDLLNGHRFESVTVKQKHFLYLEPMRDEAREISR